MTFLLLWGGLWVAFFILAVLAIAMTPTTVATPNSALIAPALWCGAISLVAAITLHGAFSLISGLFK